MPPPDVAIPGYFVSCSAPDGLTGTSATQAFDSLDDLPVIRDTVALNLRSVGCQITGTATVEDSGYVYARPFASDSADVVGTLRVCEGGGYELDRVAWPNMTPCEPPVDPPEPPDPPISDSLMVEVLARLDALEAQYGALEDTLERFSANQTTLSELLDALRAVLRR